MSFYIHRALVANQPRMLRDLPTKRADLIKFDEPWSGAAGTAPAGHLPAYQTASGFAVVPPTKSNAEE